MMKRFQIFRAGRHTSASGVTLDYSAEMLQELTADYNRGFSPRAPIVIGHPNAHEIANAPRYGEVNSLEFSDGRLYANADVSDSLIQLVRRGAYKKVSASFQMFKNRITGLNHVGMVNIPAVKNMESLNFSDGGNCMEFSDDGASVRQLIASLLDSYGHTRGQNHKTAQAARMAKSTAAAAKLDSLARAYQQTHGVDYQTAVRACINQTPDY